MHPRAHAHPTESHDLFILKITTGMITYYYYFTRRGKLVWTTSLKPGHLKKESTATYTTMVGVSTRDLAASSHRCQCIVKCLGKTKSRTQKYGATT